MLQTSRVKDRSAKMPVAPVPGPLSPKPPRKPLRSQNLSRDYLREPARRPPNDLPPDFFPRKCVYGLGRGLARWKVVFREIPEMDTARGGFDCRHSDLFEV